MIRSKIKLVSKKRAALNRQYTLLRKQFLSEHSCCEAGLEGCTGCRMEYMTVHHKKGRGEYFLDTKTWLASCFTCHQWIERNPSEAKELGFSESRLSLT